MQDLTLEHFVPWVNEQCEVTAPDGRVTMTLVAAEPLPHAHRDGGGFRLELEGPTSPMLGQSMMTVSGPTDTHEIFIVPIAQDARATRYEAIFY